jgi:hypothetical protein
LWHALGINPNSTNSPLVLDSSGNADRDYGVLSMSYDPQTNALYRTGSCGRVATLESDPHLIYLTAEGSPAACKSPSQPYQQWDFYPL